MAESSSDALPLRPMASTLLTGLFLPAHTPPPIDVPLPDAPLPHTALRLPAGGVTLFYGIHAPRWLGQALQRAQQQGYYGIGARAFATFNQVQQASRQLPFERLPEVEVLWFNRMYCTREIAERIQDHTRRYLTEAGMSLPPRHAALRFDEISQHPEFLQRLLTEPEFAHLRAVVATLPGCQAPDGNRPSVQIMYVRDLSAVQSIQIDYGAPLGQAVFRVPAVEEVATPSALFNPFAATLPKPNVVYVRPWPVG